MEDTTSNAFMNTTIINRSLSDDYYDDNYDYYGIVMYLPSRYYGHVNWAIGTMGNILSFMVFSRNMHMHSAAGFLFKSLAIADLITLQ